MSEENLQALRHQLALKQKELDLISAIDHIRDTAPDPLAMLSAIVNTLADQFNAKLCLICLLNRESNELELQAIHNRSGQLDGLRISRELAEQVWQSDQVVIWQGYELTPALALDAQYPQLPETLEVAGIPQATYELIEGQVQASPISGLRLKGMEQDVTVYHVTRVMRHN